MSFTHSTLPKVLILGGGGRIGRSVATDLGQYTEALVTLTGRQPQPNFQLGERQQYQSLNLASTADLTALIATHDLTIHCAGPFRSRDLQVLEICLAQGKPYVDVADSPDYVRQALQYQTQAQAQGVTCVLSTGVFPGVSNSLVRQGIEQFDQADTVHLSYLVAGSGGAGVTVMRTTFLELQTPFLAKVEGHWRQILPYCDREVLDFPSPYNTGAGVYWYSTVEAMTLPQSFPQLQTVVTKFGSVPDFYNRLTQLMTQLPAGWLHHPAVIEGLAYISYGMTQLTDRWSGTGIAMRLEIQGSLTTGPATYLATATHPDTAQAAGFGTGSLVQRVLSGEIHRPGVWPVEQVMSTDQFTDAMAVRGFEVQQRWLTASCPGC